MRRVREKNARTTLALSSIIMLILQAGAHELGAYNIIVFVERRFYRPSYL